MSYDIGLFQNSIFKARLALAQGFIPELRNALQSFNEFANSTEGNQTFLELGTLVGKFITVLAEVPQYFDEIILGVKVFAGLKLAGYFLDLTQGALQARNSFVGVGQSMAVIGPQMQQMTLAQRVLGQGFAQVVGRMDEIYRARLLASTAATGTAATGTRAFAATLGGIRTVMMVTANVARTMWAAIGGIPGIIATGLVFAIGSWMTSVDDATSALSEHERQLAAVKQAYAEAGSGVENWSKMIKGVSLAEAETNMADLASSFQGRLDEMLWAAAAFVRYTIACKALCMPQDSLKPKGRRSLTM